MKTIAKLIILTFVLFAAAGCSINSTNSTLPAVVPDVSEEQSEKSSSEKTAAFFTVEDGSKIVTELTSTGDYLFMTPEQLYKQSDLVVIGRFTGNKGSFVESQGRIKTNAELSVDSILKGESAEKTIQVVLNGGIVPFADYYETFDQGSQEKMGDDIAAIKSSDLVRSFQGLNQTDPLFDHQYLIFLGKMDDGSRYFLGSDAYSMLEVKDGSYLDRTTNEWSLMSKLSESAAAQQ